MVLWFGVWGVGLMKVLRVPVSSERSTVSGHVVPSFRALSGCLKFAVRRHNFNKDSLLVKGFGGRSPAPLPLTTYFLQKASRFSVEGLGFLVEGWKDVCSCLQQPGAAYLGCFDRVELYQR